jgi:hypothetical protein
MLTLPLSANCSPATMLSRGFAASHEPYDADELAAFDREGDVFEDVTNLPFTPNDFETPALQ